MQASTTALFRPWLSALLAASLAMAFVLLSWFLPAAAEPAGPGRIQLTQAQFRAPGATTWQPVALPDTWVLRDQPAGGTGHYRLSFTLPVSVTEVWAVDAERLSTAHELRLNGTLVHGSLQATPSIKRAVHTLIALPPQLLRQGENTLDIAVGTLTTAGMSALTLGPAVDLEADFRRSQLRATALPQIANIAAGGVSLFMLVMWWRRRSEVAIGAFGVLCLLASVRNYGYFVTAAPLSSPWSSWLFMQAALLTTLLLGVFAMAFTERGPRWYRRWLWATAVLFPPLSLWALGAGALQTARLWLYPLLLLQVVPALVLLLQRAMQRHKPAGSGLENALEVALVASLAGVLVAAVHDYRYQQGRLSIMGSFWMPYAVPVVVAVFSALLLRRLLASMDLAERMNVTLERQVAERTQELHEANAAKSRFLAAASHDLRQPMVSIGLLVGLIGEMVGQGGSAALRRAAQRLQEATAAMETLLTQLLDLSRLQSGTLGVQRQPVAAQALLAQVASQHGEQARRKGLRLQVRPSAAVLDGDPVLLQQILGNLLGNAMRYTATGGVLMAVRPAGPAHWRLAVWDTGPGIPAAQQEIIFGEYVRGAGTPAAAETASGLGLGLGLGLAIAQRSAALLDTRVELRSRPGRGSCFSVILPRVSKAVAAAAVPPQATAPAPLAQPLFQRRLWLLEDDDHVRASLQLQLQHWGAQVQAHATIASLLASKAWLDVEEAAQAPQPELLITDLNLPDGQATALLAPLRQRWPGLAVLGITASAGPQDEAGLKPWREAGVPVLIKPFASAALQAAVLAALHSATA